ncbi:polysaccharide deacetylase family protein [Conexibacter arvalis]|uniref:Peptidoglycan/xylan/chitin deacetylase (PgdA/CDA1 family) n=1 Tax=Conexibacter arvalis TaxID=912552 RepID=A0A840IIE6_9ACTN|nr:polysaccharide deacetylase family protein [Conexibacter arvalis]MBB4663718.1 peptidoglycan/xylan/chitin deacetylase (PgdA/CDA1 family) [Conexibacter arvalis]
MNVDELLRVIRGPARPTQRELRYRRRRASLLAAVALCALLVGVIVGAGSRGGGSQAQAEQTEVGWFGHLGMLAGAGRGSFSLEQRSRENAAIDDTLAKMPLVRMGGRQTREVALTFDDGPGADTDALLDLLERMRVPATFFMLGKNVAQFPQTVQRLIDAGVPIDNHTVDHPNLTQLSAVDQRAQIAGAAQTIEDSGAAYPRLFRPPYGAYDQTTHEVLGRLRMLSVLWSVDSEDYTKPGVDAIVDKVVSGIHPGAIVLMHDGGGDRTQTIAAVERIVPLLRRQGYRFVTVPRLLLDNPPEASEQGLPEGFNSSGAG